MTAGAVDVAVCSRYGAPGCGMACCLATAEQFAFYVKNEPPFQAYCPLVARYGETLLGSSRDAHADGRP